MKTKELWLGKLAVGILAAGLWSGDMVVSTAGAQVGMSVELNIQ